jgi:hypothetical protein
MKGFPPRAPATARWLDIEAKDWPYDRRRMEYRIRVPTSDFVKEKDPNPKRKKPETAQLPFPAFILIRGGNRFTADETCRGLRARPLPPAPRRSSPKPDRFLDLQGSPLLRCSYPKVLAASLAFDLQSGVTNVTLITSRIKALACTDAHGTTLN